MGECLGIGTMADLEFSNRKGGRIKMGFANGADFV